MIVAGEELEHGVPRDLGLGAGVVVVDGGGDVESDGARQRAGIADVVDDDVVRRFLESNGRRLHDRVPAGINEQLGAWSAQHDDGRVEHDSADRCDGKRLGRRARVDDGAAHVCGRGPGLLERNVCLDKEVDGLDRRAGFRADVRGRRLLGRRRGIGAAAQTVGFRAGKRRRIQAVVVGAQCDLVGAGDDCPAAYCHVGVGGRCISRRCVGVGAQRVRFGLRIRMRVDLGHVRDDTGRLAAEIGACINGHRGGIGDRGGCLRIGVGAKPAGGYIDVRAGGRIRQRFDQQDPIGGRDAAGADGRGALVVDCRRSAGERQVDESAAVAVSVRLRVVAGIGKQREISAGNEGGAVPDARAALTADRRTRDDDAYVHGAAVDAASHRIGIVIETRLQRNRLAASRRDLRAVADRRRDMRGRCRAGIGAVARDDAAAGCVGRGFRLLADARAVRFDVVQRFHRDIAERDDHGALADQCAHVRRDARIGERNPDGDAAHRDAFGIGSCIGL